MRLGSGARRSTAKGLSVRSRVFGGAEGGGAHDAEAAGVGDGGDELVEGDAAHAGEENGVLDAEQVADGGVERMMHGLILRVMGRSSFGRIIVAGGRGCNLYVRVREGHTVSGSDIWCAGRVKHHGSMTVGDRKEGGS
jgi:hypothetical protein